MAPHTQCMSTLPTGALIKEAATAVGNKEHKKATGGAASSTRDEGGEAPAGARSSILLDWCKMGGQEGTCVQSGVG